MTLLIFYLILAIGVSFLCSILEAVLLSITPSYIAVLEKNGHESGVILRSLKKDIDRPLSAILSLNTIAHTIGAAGVGAQAQVVFGNTYVTITSIVLTLMILIFSEIIPKTLGATYWKKLSGFAARTTKGLIIVTYPLVLLSKGITNLLSSEEKQPSVSREEFSAMADLGHEEGIFEEEESNIFKNLIRFNSLRVKDIMTPRIVVVKFPEVKTIQEVMDSKEELRVSRIPVYGKNEEDVTGYILKNDLYLAYSQGGGTKTLQDIKREVLIIPENISIKTLFERLLESQEHIAVVVDEYGGFSGVVTMEDVVETLLGMEIVDEIDAIDDMQKLARQKWRERAKRLGIPLPGSVESEEKDSA
ncbi:CNNM domain-containing protein [Rhodohalobacter sulfatireducens]|uniref:Hemolysin family protein n=1 Tax=Rhodohalobacter sulfatireducens TaxID=2911366 RepID=A0ABS9KBT7_9BACT|nr:hemolysin family protein [Rhodohalobacter sulfatireducens]MCG2588313.1 hemolysin family protein [Rhodohalobacter sulfatireducens]MDR9365719.1 hemolysin family protein [Balneolaceae bacterium]MDR9408653.1 hemolysin family protein [Balneolaceae bacterium]